jgi:tight adherence protein C
MKIFIETVMNPQFMATLLAAIAVFATVLTLALPILQRDRTAQRMKVMAVERDQLRSARMSEISVKGGPAGNARLRQAPKSYMQQIVDQLDLRKVFDNEELRNQLKSAGLRGQAPLVAFMFFRVAAPPVCFLAGLVYLFAIGKFTYPPAIKFMMAIGCGFLGYYLPNVFVTNLAGKRQQSIKAAFPDALDMLLICVQSGMSIEASFGKVAKEIVSQSVEMGEELALTTAEMSYLQERRMAFENLGKRTGLPGVKAVATALIQAEKYGSPISQALRVMAKENRDIRMSEAEKKAAALPPKLTVPMMLFFLPVLFVVILGPAAINVLKMS